MIASIIEPLAKKVKLFDKDLDRIEQGLIKGDPTAIERVKDLSSAISKLYQDCVSTAAQINSTGQLALNTSKIQPGGSIVTSSFIYYLKEGFAALDLITAVIELITKLISINNVLQLMMGELTSAYEYLNTQTVWLNKAIARTKEKVSKSIEWQRRILAANASIFYLTAQQKRYQNMLSSAEAKLPIKPEPIDGINGEFIDGIFIYYDKPQNPQLIQAIADNANVSQNTSNTTVAYTNPAILDITSETQISNIKLRLTEITEKIDKEKLELSWGIPQDKLYWRKRWSAEEKNDLELLKSIKEKYLV